MAYVALIVSPRRAAALLLLGVIMGCAQSERGEAIFVGQNQVAAALGTMLMEAETQDPRQADRLYDAESSLAEACAPLRQAAQQKMIGEEISLELELTVFRIFAASAWSFWMTRAISLSFTSRSRVSSRTSIATVGSDGRFGHASTCSSVGASGAAP